MATGTRISEDGNRRISESVAGFTGASSLNDVAVFNLNKETFAVNPTGNGFIIGVSWSWNSTNQNMQAI